MEDKRRRDELERIEREKRERNKKRKREELERKKTEKGKERGTTREDQGSPRHARHVLAYRMAGLAFRQCNSRRRLTVISYRFSR